MVVAFAIMLVGGLVVAPSIADDQAHALKIGNLRLCKKLFNL
jgi:hypothetical protein